MDVVKHQTTKHFSNISTIVNESSSSTQVRETTSHQNTAGPSRNVSEIVDTVFLDGRIEEVDNLQEEDCDKSSGYE